MQNTAARTLSQLRKHVYPVLGARPLAAIRPSELQAWVAGLSTTLAPGSIRTVVATVRAVLGAAVRDRAIGRDPADGLKLPTVDRVKVVPLTVDQVDALAAAVPEAHRALVVVVAGTGLRQGEAFGLQVRDVDFLRRLVKVERQVHPAAGGGYAVAAPKNRASARTIPVGTVVVGELAEHLRAYPATGEDFVLRHFYASALIRAGLSVKVVSERLGHSNAAMTLNVYAHLWPDDEDRTRQAIDEVFRRDVPTVRPGRAAPSG
ncbi:MAG TPA: site-specific integrase [Micromonosporaceae bacterium]|nr:site-specific integrase [Micromonosporaceae bacterium]